MRASKIIVATLAASALLTASVASADARGFWHRGHGPGVGLIGGVVLGAAAIATLPFALLANGAYPGPSARGYYGQGEYDYGPSQAGYGPPPGPPSQGGGYYGPPNNYGYGYGPPPPPPPPYRGYYGPPPGYGYGPGY
jgi:hypothetical protein